MSELTNDATVSEFTKVASAALISAPFILGIAFLNYGIGLSIDRSIVGWTVWFVLPLGAMLIGWGGALGFSIVEMFTQNRDSTAMGLASMATGLIALIATYGVLYSYEALPGERVGEFLSAIARSPIDWEVDIRDHSASFQTGGVSLLGWLALIPQPIGAIFGGVVAIAAAPKWLSKAPATSGELPGNYGDRISIA